nr:AAA family ATPase [Actinomyces bowdenii]
MERAVQAAPDDVPLRLHLAEQLISAGRGEEAITHCAMALQHSPGDQTARDLMARALAPSSSPQEPAPPETTDPTPQQPGSGRTPEEGSPPAPAAPDGAIINGPATDSSAPADSESARPAPSAQTAASPGQPEPTAAPTPPEGSQPPADFDWQRAEEDLGPAGPAAPFVPGTTPQQPERIPTSTPEHAPEDWEVETPGITLADVGGLSDVKDRLEASFLAPMRNPELRRLYGKSLRGGLLLYGPPGVGKTFIARAVAGEMGAGFINVTLTDVLDPYLGNSEARLHDIFQRGRRSAPCVVFLDEIDAIGLKRSATRWTGLRGVINQLLQELDGVEASNEGLYVLAATNAPWDIDPALRRPGRLDRAVLVLPPDAPARSAILHSHLKNRPIEGIDLDYLSRATDGLTGADLAHLCETAAEKALMESVRTGVPRMIQMRDLQAALAEVRPSTGPWFDVARNVVEYADHSGEYEPLRQWMKARRLL